MLQNPEFYKAFINQLPSEAKAQFRGKYALIVCKWHNDHSPSMKVSFVPGARYQAGTGKCFSCGKTASMNDIAAAYGLPGYVSSTVSTPEEVITTISQDEVDEMLGHNDKTYGLDLSTMTPWKSKEVWRGISGKLVRNVGGHVFFNEKFRGSQLYLPCHVNDVHIGGIRANIVKRGKANYFNTDGGWTSKVLYPYDYVRDNFSNSTVVIVEGPRDALNLLQHDIPALALLGAGTWNKIKELLVLSLDPTRVITALDPDQAGNLGTVKINKTLKDVLDVKRFKMCPEDKEAGIEKEDPGNLTLDRINQLKRHLI